MFYFFSYRKAKTLFGTNHTTNVFVFFHFRRVSWSWIHTAWCRLPTKVHGLYLTSWECECCVVLARYITYEHSGYLERRQSCERSNNHVFLTFHCDAASRFCTLPEDNKGGHVFAGDQFTESKNFLTCVSIYCLPLQCYAHDAALMTVKL